MSNSIQSTQAEQAQTQTEQTVQPPKKPQTINQVATPRDTVTISKAGQQAAAGNAKFAPSGDVDHDSDNH